ncbi:nitroreductase family protein [Candidatus Dependentiae bacterium]|nr:nitroreductase family protein [Candidatus Dependentiae bacterium]
MNPRIPDYPINPLFIKRWSPRAMSGELLTTKEIMSLFEAARWAPSSYNNQPWRFLYAKKHTANWDLFFNLLVPANQEWAKSGAVLIVLVSHNAFEFNNKPSRTHSFDAGSACENLALQGADMNLVVHAMEGFDYDKARQVLAIPSDYTVEAMIVVGKPGALEVLSEKLQEKEVPSTRKTVDEIACEGVFQDSLK